MDHQVQALISQIKAISATVDGEKAVLDYYTTDIDKVSDTEYIRLVNQMSTAGKCYRLLPREFGLQENGIKYI